MKKFGTAVILAGGKSTRMGFDKQFLRINEKRLMDSLVEELSEIFDKIIVISNKPEKYRNVSYMVKEDIIPGKGPLSGIHSGLKNASSQYVYFIACDMPNVNLDYIRYMAEEIEDLEVHACITKFGEHMETLNAFYSKDIIEQIENNLSKGKRSIKHLLSDLKVHYIQEKKAREFSPNWEMFINLNTVEQLIENS